MLTQTGPPQLAASSSGGLLAASVVIINDLIGAADDFGLATLYPITAESLRRGK
ncbi:MAG: hypothetical protein ACLQNV_08485 [Steroidobacteraceae bacterium]